MKPDVPPVVQSPASFDRPKLLLFKFLAHQIHPFAFAVNTFLQPALDDCMTLLHSNPQDTFNILLSLTQTFTRFAPDSELIYDDIQQFAVKLKDAIDECFTWLDPSTIQQSSQLLESTHQSLSTIIRQHNGSNTPYATMYKNMSAALVNLEKINSLPVEMQTMSLGETLNKTVTVPTSNKQQSVQVNGNAQTGLSIQSIHQNGNGSASTRPVPSAMVPPPVHNDKPLSFAVPPPANPLHSIPPVSLRQQHSTVVLPPPPPITTNMNMTNQVKNLSTSKMPLPPSVSLNANNSMPTLSLSSRPESTTSYMSEYEVMDTTPAPVKKPTPTVAAFPPRQNTSLFTSTAPTNDKPITSTAIPVSTAPKTNMINGNYLSSLLNGIVAANVRVTPATRVIDTKNEIDDNSSERDTPTPTPSNDDGIRFGTTPGPYAQSVASSVHGDNDDEGDEETGRQYYTDPRFYDPIVANAEWRPARGHLSILVEQSRLDQTMPVAHPHVTDEYLQEFGNKQTRPVLRGELAMTFGTPQAGPQSDCMPIGVGLSYDELTLLSCDVHRSAQSVRLFDIQTGRLRHTISSSQHMKFHRPSAVTSNARNNILIVERDYIYVVEPDGRLVQTIGHRSVKQLYGIALFRDRYLLTIDSKATDHKSAEKTRLLLFDPNSNNQLVYEQCLKTNQEPEEILRQQKNNHIQGRVLPETLSKPRFLALHNDNIYIADLGRSLIYGANIHGQFDLSCTTVFGGHGRSNGEMSDPSGLFVDSGGNIISADSKNDRIQLFAPDGQYKTTMKLNERIKRPSGLCSNRAGTQFYVSCYLAGCVRAFNINY